jgi:hypothetical protein
MHILLHFYIYLGLWFHLKCQNSKTDKNYLVFSAKGASHAVRAEKIPRRRRKSIGHRENVGRFEGLDQAGPQSRQ